MDIFRHDRANWFRDFIRNGDFSKNIEDMVQDTKNRLVINLNEVREHDVQEYKNLLERPMDCLPAYEQALKTYIDNNAHLDPKLGTFDAYHISIEGAFGAHRLAPREVMSDHLTQMVAVEGIVIKTSTVQPKVVKTVHYCKATGAFQTQSYRDGTDFSGHQQTGSAYPTTDKEGNPLSTEHGLCEYRNHQRVYIQDMPERTVAGTMPRTIEVIVEGDLVDNCKPGDRVQMIGVYRALAGRGQGHTSGRYKTVLIGNNIRRIGMDEKKRDITPEDLPKIRKIKGRKDVFDLVSRSVAPCIYGHEWIKKAVTLMLLGGCEKNLDNGTHIRGDINILMVGDPSTAKSQLLRAVKNVGPLVINTTGRGSSGVGLTAAVNMDKDTGERKLEAGAMVLADRGIVCIDEFDKMSDQDRTAIHEVMEQQTVTIAKAGIHCSLNARCSVIAASNPVYGQYDRSLPPAQNIALPDSLLSRFDVLFIVLDKLDPRMDRAISEHVLKMHQFDHKEKDSLDVDSEDEQEEAHQTQVFEKSDKFGVASKLRRGKKKLEYLTSDFVKKYIKFAKTKAERKPPVLTDEARESIATKYAELRSSDNTQTLPITARCLETMIRLASAHAKLRMDTKVTEGDVNAIYQLLNFALTNDAVHTPQDENAPKKRLGPGMDVDGEEEEESQPSAPSQAGRRKRKKPENHESPEQMKTQRTQRQGFAQQPERMDEDEKEALPVNPQQQKQLTKALNRHFRSKRIHMVKTDDFYSTVTKDAQFASLSKQDYTNIIKALHDESKLFLRDGEIHRL